MRQTATVATAATFFGGPIGAGVAARIVACGGDVSRALRTNALLRKDEWQQLDDAVLEEARRRMTLLADLQGRGLTFPLGGLGVMETQWERVSDMTPAEQSMAAETRGQLSTVNFDLVSAPVPITFKDFQLDIRRLLASRNRGEPLDRTQARLSGALVTEALEGMILNGSTVQIGQSRMYGYRTFPQRLTGSLSGDWGDENTSGEEIVADVLHMVKRAQDNRYYGPYVLYVGTAYNLALNRDFKKASDKTIRQRIQEIDEIEAVRTSAFIPDGEVLLVQMTSNVVDLGVAQDITTVEWGEMGGFLTNFRTFCAMVVRLKADQKGRTGIVHYTVGS